MRSPNPVGNRILVIGCGRAGATLALTLASRGFTVGVRDRNAAKARALSRRLPRNPKRPGPWDLAILAVPDPAIPGAARALAREGLAPGLALHLGGAAPVEALAPLAAAGWRTAKLHPVYAFPLKPVLLPGGVTFGIRASSPAAYREVERLARRLGGRPVRIAEGMDAAWHLACVLAGNGLFAQLHAAETVMESASEPSGRAVAALAPLVASSLHNALESGLVRGLTGPVARGEAGTLEEHLAVLLERFPEISVLYAATTAMLVRSLPPTRRAVLRRRLKRGGLLL